MADIIDALPPADRRLVTDMAVEAQVDISALTVEIVRSYLGLVRATPEALPDTPLRRLTSERIARRG